MADADVAHTGIKAVERYSLQIIKGIGISFVGNMIGKVFNFLLQIVLARGLGAGNYGLYTIAESILAVLRLLASLGLDRGGVLKFASIYAGERDMRRLKGVIIEAFGLSLCSSILFVTLLFFLSPWLSLDVFHESSLKVLLRILSIALPFHVLLLMVAAIARALRRMEYDAALRSCLLPAANLAGASLALLFGFGLYGMAWCIVGSMVLSVWGGLFALKQVAYGRLSGVAPIYHSSKALLSVSLPIAVVSLSNVVSMQSDKLILGAFVDAADVGLYNAAFRIAWFLQLILLSFGVFPPIVADLYNRGRVEELRSLLARTTRWIFSAMFPLFLVIVLFPKELIGVFGPEFMEGWPILVALSFLFLVDALTGQVGPVLRMTGNQGIEAAINATSVVLSVLVNLILVQQHGVLGVAVGTTLILSLQRVSKAIALYIVLGIHPYDRCFLRPVAVGLLGLGAVWVVRSLNWTILGVSEALLEASLLIGVYLGLSLLFFPEEDIATLKLIFFRVIQGIWNR